MSRAFYLLSAFLLLTGFAAAQSGGTSRQISGQVRVDGRPGPQGIQVLLDRSRGRDTSFAGGAGEFGNIMTDAQGKFVFEHFDDDSRFGDGKIYVVSVRFPGYLSAHQIVDLTANPRGYVNFDLRRDTVKDAPNVPNVPNVPDEGPGGAISARQPSSPEAQAALGKGEELLLQKGDARGSVEYFKKAVTLDPQFVPGYLLLATAYLQTGSYPEAQSVFEKASKVDPTNAIALIGIGAALNEQQKWEEAQGPLLRGLVLNPGSAEGHYEAGRGLYALGRWQEAQPHAIKAIELNKSYPGPHVLMGNIYLRNRNANSALDEYREYLKLDPQGDQAAEVKKMVTRIEKALREN